MVTRRGGCDRFRQVDRTTSYFKMQNPQLSRPWINAFSPLLLRLSLPPFRGPAESSFWFVSVRGGSTARKTWMPSVHAFYRPILHVLAATGDAHARHATSSRLRFAGFMRISAVPRDTAANRCETARGKALTRDHLAELQVSRGIFKRKSTAFL